MKTYQKTDGSLWAFEEDGSQDHLITEDMRLLTEPELEELQGPFKPSKEARIATLQAAYEIDREQLHKAWLAALIADGVGEGSRQAILKQQMDDLAAQLDIDILNIIMEE